MVRQPWKILALLVLDAAVFGQVSTPNCSVVLYAEGDGSAISVGCPKVWRSARLFSVIDGITRDLDSISVRALELLDPNETNQALLDSVKTSFDAAVKFDQVQAINNSLALQKIKAERANNMIVANNAQQHLRDLQERRSALFNEITQLQIHESELVAKGTPDTDQNLINTRNQEKTLQTQLDSVNSDISNAKDATSIPDAKLDPNSATTADTTKTSSGNGGPFGSLSDNFKSAIQSKLNAPTLPAGMQLDNVIDLLRQRLSRQFSAMYDDLMHDDVNHDVYLLEFDSSLHPDGKVDDRIARVQFQLNGVARPNASPINCSDIRTYDVYPSTAAYNIMQGFDKTTHVGLAGAAQTIIGWGVSAAFQRDHSTLRSGMSQSFYITGFGSGQRVFGWDFSPNPYEAKVAPGIRSTYAILLAPKGADVNCDITANVSAWFVPKGRRYPGWNPANWRRTSLTLNGDNRTLSVPLPSAPQLSGPAVEEIAYVPAYSKRRLTDSEPPPQRSEGKPIQPGDPADTVILIRLRQNVDSNLVISANGKVIDRVRDVRGRGLYAGSKSSRVLAGSDEESNLLKQSRFGILESDTLQSDTWYVADPHDILLRIGKSTAGTESFPTIYMIDPVHGGAELARLAQQADRVRVGEWLFTQTASLPPSAFHPLYAGEYGPGQVRAFIESSSAWDNGRLQTLEIRLQSKARRPDGRPIHLHDHAQVVLEANETETAAAQPPNWIVECRQDRGELVCPVNLPEIAQYCGDTITVSYTKARDLSCVSRFKVWVDQTPYYERPGLWADVDPPLPDAGLVPVPRSVIPRNTYTISEQPEAGNVHGFSWTALLELRNVGLPVPTVCVEEFRNLRSLAARKKQLNAALALKEATDFTRRNGISPEGSPFEVELLLTNPARLRITVPFSKIWLLPDSYTLNLGCLLPEATDYRAVELPNLKEQLLPHNLKVIPTGNNAWRIQGTNMAAINEVYFEGAKSRLLGVGSDNLSTEFSAPKDAEPGTYKVYLGIQKYFVPARQWNNTKSEMEQISLTIAPSSNR